MEFHNHNDRSIGGLQWDRVNFDRVIDRMSKKNMDMPKMNKLK